MVRPDLVIRGGRLDSGQADVVVHDGSIVAVTPAGQGGTARQVIDASGLCVLPGGIDAHVHFDAPGRDHWEGWATGSLAAAAGGVTTVVDMPIDSHPPTIDPEAVWAKRQAAERSSLVDFALWGGLVPENASALEPLLASGVIGLKAFMCESGWPEFPPCDVETLSLGLAAAAQSGLPTAVHCEDPSLFGAGPLERPLASEVQAVAHAAAAAALHGARLHVVHCSSADAVVEAKRWPRTTVETCPHYLALNDQDVERIGPDAICCPPVRDGDNRERLVTLVAEGLVDTLASDHSPCPPELKEGDAPFAGVAGVQTALSVLLSVGGLGLPLVNRLRTQAARLLGLGAKGAVAAGYDADLALVDLDAAWTVSPVTLLTRHRRSPFMGMTLPGVVVITLVRGRVVYQAGQQMADRDGIFLHPNQPMVPNGPKETTAP
jgi:allantoinase